MRKAVLIAIVLILVGSRSFCFGAGGAIDEAKRTDIKRLLDLTTTDAFVETWVNGFMQLFSDAAAAARTEEEKAAIKNIYETVSEVVIEDSHQMFDKFIPLYDEHYTHDEIRKLIKFYESPVGKKTIEVQPVLTQKAMEIGREWGMSLAPKIEQRLKEKGYLE